MPHYHPFGWYYFLKYIIGFAGMFFLYSGFVKNGTISCFGKEEKSCDNYTHSNESCPTGDRTDVRAKTKSNVRIGDLAYAAEKQVQTSMPMIRRREEMNRNAITSNSLKSRNQINQDSKVHISLCTYSSNSHGSPEFRKRKKHYSECCRDTRFKENGTRSSACMEIIKKEKCNCRSFDAIARTNRRLRNSLVDQEYLELQAFARSIFNHNSYPAVSCHRHDTSMPSNSSDCQEERNVNETSDSDCETENYSSEYCSNVGNKQIRCAVPVREKQNQEQLPSSSKRKMQNCKIHERQRVRNFERTNKQYRCRRIINDPLKKNRISEKGQVTRYRSTTIFAL